MDNKNMILAILLSMGFLLIWSIFVTPRFAPPRPPEQAMTEQAPASAAAPTLPQKEAEFQNIPPELSRDVTVTDHDTEITATAKGAAVRHWIIKTKGKEIDLVLNPDAPLLPLASFPNVTFSPSVSGRQVQWTGFLPNGLRMTKTLSLSDSNFLQDLSFRFENRTGQPVELSDFSFGWGPGIGAPPEERKENNRLIRALSLGNIKMHPLKAGESIQPARWFGMDNRYFLVAFIPDSVVGTQLNVTGSKEETAIQAAQTLTIPAHGQTLIHYGLYAGPKGYTYLRQYGKGLEEGVDFGLFSWLGKLILRAIYRLQRMTGNYGWAIVILTVILQVLFMPLTMKSFKATMAMKKLQPQIAVLQKQYKSDPKRLNVEMMNLYKKSGTNPFGGCLPMLLQLPIFWALFTTLRNAYELRGAPWIFWIRDLSAADPLHILPITMGIAMFFQQRMAGAVTDPTQRQMMYVMPIMFTVMFFNFPSGLVLYWFVNNLLTMAFQWNFQRRHP
jgi:YidC/Oxa1 family membrane protein insertase